jgi:cystathionine beta-lyase
MDFTAPPAVINALKQRVEHGVFGYTNAPDELTELIIERLYTYYQWAIQPEWLVFLPGVVSGIHLACQITCQAGDKIISPIPVYPPFLSAPGLTGRTLVTVPLILTNGHQIIDWQQLDVLITPDTRLLILCNPHNPGGAVYSRQELSQLLAIAERHQLVICSDEIHCDLVLDPTKQHIPFASLDPKAEDLSITLMAPSKTFNIPGLGCAFAIIPDSRLRQRFLQAKQGIVPDVNTLGYSGALAAYQQGDSWHQALIDYLRSNRDYLIEAINALPGLSLDPLEATYLAWIDASGLQLADPALFFEQAGVGLSPGANFGAPQFVRLNFGCSRQLLEQAISRMAKACTERLKN